MNLVLSAGQIFADDYRVIGPLAEGGMGTVYEVEQLSTGKRRALKVMRAPNAKMRDDLRRRFEQEARIGAMIESEHVVDVIAAGVDSAHKTPWLAMELLEGQDLGQLLEKEGAMAIDRVAEIGRQLFHALAAAHDISVVHRDLKPENVFLATSRLADRPFLLKVLDFGIAKLVSDNVAATAAVGTPLWMAPEQTDSKGRISPSSDVWALGLIMFRLLTGRLYWKAANTTGPESAQVLMREMLFEPLETASARAAALGGAVPSAAFDSWFARCVTRDPNQRFPQARAAWNALNPILDDSLIVAPPSRPLYFGGATPSDPFGPTQLPVAMPTEMATDIAVTQQPMVVQSSVASTRPAAKKRLAMGIAAAVGLVVVAGSGLAFVRSSHSPSVATAPPEAVAPPPATVMTIETPPPPVPAVTASVAVQPASSTATTDKPTPAPKTNTSQRTPAKSAPRTPGPTRAPTSASQAKPSRPDLL